ncbi:hydrogenase maturation protein HypF [Marinobacterium halophilum]|uniref:Carbamoyltransferase HypF n=1 Tax=Marinobacterium halophilum TaxID=267374 RepID=A0A2P8ENB6_9GAMM|nr:carbamoyltransferase HypF [Marinobacterium halophilum]PSL10965.1 hydrogenase maturation protein HypF [Marinobacterium halophilum]
MAFTSANAVDLDTGYLIEIKGQVQGVGFRPHVWRTAVSLQLCGDVCNTAAGVRVRLLCSASECDRFVQVLLQRLPPLARVEQLRTVALAADVLNAIAPGFQITPSAIGEAEATVPADAATCVECLAELFDPTDRRFRYPFINCTHCGPRLGIIEGMPYDRVRTTMSAFTLCPTCAREYADPSRRRFHAQPNACPDCGPRLWLETGKGQRLEADDPFVLLAAALAQGQIVAIKGLGGFHLCCAADNTSAVRRLRQRKQRPAKALALMFRDLAHMRTHVDLDPEEAALLTSAAAPIVLCHPDASRPSTGISAEVAPDSAYLGCMLPATPLHHLLMAAVDGPLVMTSGNRSGMPQVIDNEMARCQLGEIADLLVFHDRRISHRVDDPVMRIQANSGQAETVRPGRGLAPLHLPLPPGFAATTEVLALGGDLKNTFCMVNGGQAILSQYLGDLQSLAIHEAAIDTRQRYRQLYRHRPVLVVCDRHPGYHSTMMAQTIKAERFLQVQHHHAHLASCLGEYAYPLAGSAVLGICLDGTGYGKDGGLWGGEFLYGGYTGVERLASLRPCALPGSAAAVREPWRVLVAQLLAAGVDPASTADIWPWLAAHSLETIERMIAQGVNAPLTSSAGRLFDAMAAALECYAEAISYEGQAAVALETLALRHGGSSEVVPYRWALLDTAEGLQLDSRPVWRQVVSDMRAKRTPAEMAMAFHLGLADGLAELALRLQQDHPYDTLVMTGGVMQNALLADRLEQLLNDAGIRVLRHRQVPCNDSGLSLGQALVALAMLQREGGDDA